MFCYKINFSLTETGENLISALPPISAHLVIDGWKSNVIVSEDGVL